ncbi:CgeB family protein [Lachnospira sp.]|jgi:spore maturation protein CgeB|uniref:CgeB family protein n=1 Tax=Lachnospira sp. TaxID=2049031 RepID=UPI00257F4CAB|nr:glycosyltransferase [Lachnospira sp.]
MKILFYRYGSICEPDIIHGFKNLGFEVEEINIEVTNKNLLPAQCVEQVSKVLLPGGFSFVFTINFFPWLSDLCQILKLRYISLIVDSPVLELFSKSLSNSFNRVFLFDLSLYNDFENENPGHIYHTPLYANTDRLDSYLESVSEAQKEKFRADISFIGSSYEEKNPYSTAKFSDYYKGYHDALIDAQLNVYGLNFLDEAASEEFCDYFIENVDHLYRFPPDAREDKKALVTQAHLSYRVAEKERKLALNMLGQKYKLDFYTQSSLKDFRNVRYRGNASSLEEMPIIFNQSKINLNFTSKAIKTGIPLRVFDILGSGGFLISNYQTELLQVFENGKDLVVYEDLDHLVELCGYYLEHDEERIEIAKNGHETVKKYHNVTTRLLQIIDQAFRD